MADADMDRWESLILVAAAAAAGKEEMVMQKYIDRDNAPDSVTSRTLNNLKGLEEMKDKLKETFIRDNLDPEEQEALLMNLSLDKLADDFVDTLEKLVKKNMAKGTKLLTIKKRQKEAYKTHKTQYIKLKSLYDNLKRADKLLLRENLSFYSALVDIIKKGDDLELSGFIGLLLFVNAAVKGEDEAIDVEDYLRIHNMEILNNEAVIKMIKVVLKRRQVKYICNTKLLEQKARLKELEDSQDNDLVIGVIDHPLGPVGAPTNTSLMKLMEDLGKKLSPEEITELDAIFHLDKESGNIIPNDGIPNKLLRTINFKMQGSEILNAGSAAVLPGVPGNKKARDYFEVCTPTQQCGNVGIQRMSLTNFLKYKKIKDNGKDFLDLLNSNPPAGTTIHENMKTNTDVKPCYICNHKIISATQLNRAKLGNNSNECEHVVPCVVFTLMFGLKCPQDAARVKDFIAGSAFIKELKDSGWPGVPTSYLGGDEPVEGVPVKAAEVKANTYKSWLKINGEVCEKEYFSSHALCNKTKTNDDYIFIDPINIYGILTPEEYETWLPNDGAEVFKHGEFDKEFDASEIAEANAAIQKLKKAKDREGVRFGFKCKYDFTKVGEHLLTILKKEGKTVASTSICGMFKREGIDEKKKGVDKKKCYIGEKKFFSSIIEDSHFIKKTDNTPNKIQKAQLKQIFKYGVAPPYLPAHADSRNTKKKRYDPVPAENEEWRCPAPTIPPLTAAGKPSTAANAKHKDRNILDLSSLYFPNEASVNDNFENYHAYLHKPGEGICDGIESDGGLVAAHGARKWIYHRINSIRIRCLLLVGAVYNYQTEALAFNYWLTSRAYLNNYMNITMANRAMPAPDTLLSSNSLPYISIQKAIDTVKTNIITTNNEPPTLTGGGHWYIGEGNTLVPAIGKGTRQHLHFGENGLVISTHTTELTSKKKDVHKKQQERYQERYINLNIQCPHTTEGVCSNWATVGRCFYRHTEEVMRNSSKIWWGDPNAIQKKEYEHNLQKWRDEGIKITTHGFQDGGGGEDAPSNLYKIDTSIVLDVVLSPNTMALALESPDKVRFEAAVSTEKRELELVEMRRDGAEGLMRVLSKGGIFPSIVEMKKLIDESKNWRGGDGIPPVISMPNIINDVIKLLPDNMKSYIINESIEPHVKYELDNMCYYVDMGNIDLPEGPGALEILPHLNTHGLNNLDIIDNIVDYFEMREFDNENRLYIEEIPSGEEDVRAKTRKKKTRKKKTRKKKKTTRRRGRKTCGRTRRKHTKHTRRNIRRRERRTLRKGIRRSIRRSISRSINRRNIRR